MGIEDYIFALFVFGLGGLLVFFLVKGLGKNRGDRNLIWEEREKKLEQMYDEITDLLDALESYIEENKTGLDRELGLVKKYLEDIIKIKNGEPLPKIEIASRTPAEETVAPMRKGDLKQQALDLNRKGLSVGDIARELGVSRGEVIFMLSLNNKTI
jgi:regulator of replication initiation timing